LLVSAAPEIKRSSTLLNDLDILSTVETSEGPHLDYWGGAVLPNATTYAVFWGPNVNATTQARIGDFLEAFTNSPMFDWLSEYDTNIRAIDYVQGTNQHIGKGTFAGAITITPTHTAAAITDSDIQAELQANIASGKLPPPTDTNIYMVYFPVGISISGSGAGQSCVNFCAYHTAINRSGSNIRYAVMPDLGPGSGCEAGCSRGATPFDSLTIASSHELIEATTDPDVGILPSLIRPSSWYDLQHDSSGDAHGEVGDICNGMATPLVTPGGTFAIQKEWSNKDSACKGIVNDDFAVTLAQPSITLDASKSQSATVTASTSVTKGEPGQISLRRVLVPPGGTASLGQEHVTAGQSFSITVTAAPGIVNGTYHIGILSSTAEITRRTPLAVTIINGQKGTPTSTCVPGSKDPLCYILGISCGGGSDDISPAFVGIAILGLGLRRLRRRPILP
jgi:hypothetical protein